MRKKKPGALPTLDVTQPEHSVSTVIIAVTGMVNGSYGDFKTGPGVKDFVHVTRIPAGSYRAKYYDELFQTDNTLRLAQFIMNRVH